jgi:hypothetical protein
VARALLPVALKLKLHPVSCVIVGPALSIALLIMTTISLGVCSSNMWAITRTLAGSQAAGRWTGVQNTGGVCLLGAISWVFVVGPVRQVEWRVLSISVLEPFPSK